MVSYTQIVRRLPQEFQMTMLELTEAIEQRMREQLAVRREDLERLTAAVDRLSQAQARTEEAQARMEEEFRRYREESEARWERIEAALARLAEAQARTEAEFREFRAQSEKRFASIEATLERLAEAQARTDATVQTLVQAQASTDATVQALIQAQARTEERVSRLEEAVARLTEAQARTEQMLQALIATMQKFEERLRRLEIRVDRMDGELLEIRYERRATSYFGRVLRRVRVVEVPELLDTLEARLTPEEVDEVLNLDLLVAGRPRRPGEMPEEREVWLAVEISATVDTEDVERALERAALLRKAGYFAIPAVAGREATSIAETAAQEQGVLLVRDGRADFWDQALVRWRG
ncbi:MAG: hypothetical protein ACP5ME_12805 [Anaerolineae bacterium]